ncbi:hypothetical protein CK203_012521 [Vitis vinifera]|uniref:Reverse transcriptase domain-containing protein n=1 Tax=Vitis vinifera TaxID=29760 RepID=A0A438KMZ7_VITVI|nr:hypothetical protein CK203_012521 [Vitis vinifera]
MADAHRRRNQLTRVKSMGDGLIFERLEGLDVEGLEKRFTEEEVFGALLSFCREKVLGPDGFPMAFWSLNAIFLVLIPKKGGAEDLKDFRPISLMGGLDKWLTKMLANKLKGYLKGLRQGDPISPYLFAIVMEAFSCLLKRAVFGGFLLPCSIRGRGGEEVKGFRVENVKELAEEFGYKVGRLPST